jgi:hypothetical protein
MSAKGSETMSILMSVFKTIELLGENVFDDTLQLAKNAIIVKKSKSINITDLSA